MRNLGNRGAAAVEMAVTMVVLIPLIFYALFLQDFLYYKLEGQEPTLSAAWDHVTPDYMRSSPAGIGNMNRLKYCDHTAAYDSYNRDFDCDATYSLSGNSGGPGITVSATGHGDLGHHHAVGAHACWLGGGQQVQCTVWASVGQNLFPASRPFLTFNGSQWNQGGMASCSARLNVFNSIIPEMISAEGGWLWSQTRLTNKTQFGRSGGGNRAGDKEWDEGYNFNDVHLDGMIGTITSSLGGGGSWIFATESVSLLVDPWALTDIKDINSHEGSPLTSYAPPGRVPGVDVYHPLLDRTANYYNYYAAAALLQSNAWHLAMRKAEFLDDASQRDVSGDHLESVPVTWNSLKPRPGFQGGFASGYADSRMPGVIREDKYPTAWGP